MSCSSRRGIVVSLAVAALLSVGLAEAQVSVVDDCDVGGASVPWDVDQLTASYDDSLQQIVVDLKLCAPAGNGTKYRVHFDHTAPFAPDLDRNGDGYVDQSDFCVTTSDDGMMYRVHRGRGKATGPGVIEVSGDTLTYTVALAELSTDLMTGDTVYIWADTHWKGIRDRAPNTEEADGCAKPEVASETLELALIPPPTPTPTPTNTPIPPTPTPTPIPPTPTPTDTPTPIPPTPTPTPTNTPTPIPPTPTPTPTNTPIPPTPTPPG
jgi:hypothetical protein